MSAEAIFDHEPWMDSGECRNPAYDPDMWSSGEQRTVDRAKGICLNECKVREQCLEWALRKDEKWHICGGLTRAERKTLTRRSA